MIRLAVLLALGALAPAAGAPTWPAPPNPMTLTREAGLTPETHEFVFLHVHAHLDVFVNGRKVRVPGGVGININDPAVKRFQLPDGTTGYGGIASALFEAVHLAAAHPLGRRHLAHRGEEPPVQQARSVLQGVEGAAQREVRGWLLQACEQDCRLRGR